MKIAHVSDIHIHKRKGFNIYSICSFVCTAFKTRIDMSVLDALFSDLKDLKDKNEFDHIVITGDITNTNHYSEFELFKNKINNTFTNGSSIDWRESDFFSAVPGNHDRGYSGNISKKFQKNIYNQPRRAKDLHPIEKTLDKNTTLILIDSTGEFPLSNLPFGCLGKIDNAQFKRLLKILEKNKDKFIILAMHHHPLIVPYYRWLAGFGILRKSRKYLTNFYSSGVDLILHGHRHYPFNWMHNPTPLSQQKMKVICAPSVACTTVYDKSILNAYNIYDIQNGKVAIRQRGYKNGRYQWLT
jgi:3',5'-cyclic AMP phosphodiesterase CpdA